MILRMIFCHCLQVGQNRYSDRYYTKDVELPDECSELVRKNEADFVGVELRDEEMRKE